MRTRKVALAAVALATVVAASACSTEPATPDTSSSGFAKCATEPNTCNSGATAAGGELIYALEQEWTAWNPNSSEGNQFSYGQASTGYIPGPGFFSPAGEWVWNLDLLAEEPKLAGTAPQSWTYKIRPEAVWSDGTAISADDFIFNWKSGAGDKALCDTCDPAGTGGTELIESVVGADGGKTVTVTLKAGKTFPEWYALFGGLLPAHLAAAQGFDLATPKGVGQAYDWFDATQPTWSGGPYSIDSFTKGQSFVLKPNAKWYGKVKPSLEKLTFRWITDQAQVIPALTNKEVHAVYPQPNPDLVTQAKAIPGVNYFLGKGSIWEHLDFNLQNKFLADKELRKALFTAINSKEIVSKTYGTFDPSAKPIGNHLFFTGPNAKDLTGPLGQGSGDIAKAKEILQAAGYTGIGTALTTPKGEKVAEIRLVHTVGNQLRATTMELVLSYLKELGIPAKIVTTETLGATLDAGDFDIIVFAWVGSPLYVTAPQQYWYSKSESNFGKLNNPELDKVIDDLQVELDPAKSAELANKTVEIVAQEFYVLPLAQKPTMLAVWDNFVNIRDNASQYGPNYNNHEWGLKAS